MKDQPSFDRSLLIPIVFGVFSIFGICLVLILGRLASSRARVTVEDTPTAFQYIFLGTEPAVVSATPDENGDEPADETPTVTVTVLSVSGSETLEPTSTDSSLVVLSTPTSTSASSAPLNPGTYDDTDSRMLYEGDWIVQRGVSGVFQNSLHVSSTLGNSVTFRFIGQQIRLFYQPGPGLGTIEINLDGVKFELDQSDNATGVSEWSSPVLINGTHTVEITHLSGGSVNLDQVIVPDVLLTPTATNTTAP
jgi:hypothetical protein